MNFKDAKIKLDGIIQELFPGINLSFCQSIIDGLKKLDDAEFKKRVLYHIDQIKNNTGKPVYWYNEGFRGVQIDDCIRVRPSKCKICGKFYMRSERSYTNTCSDECNDISRKIGNKRISESRLKYNSRDPKQYAERHGVSLEEAEKIVSAFSRKGSNLCVEFWLERGFTEDEAIKKISEQQAENSVRCIEHWLAKGFSLEESIELVSQHQRAYMMKHIEKNGDGIAAGEFSPRSRAYWIKKGYTEQEALDIIGEASRRASQVYIDTVPAEERRKNNHLCFEYWEKRVGDEAYELYPKYLAKVIGGINVSKVSLQLFESVIADLSDDYKRDYINMGDDEYCIVSKTPRKVYLYDFVDKKQKICIEFNGDYWHANPKIYGPDAEIHFPDEKVLIAKDIWEYDRIKLETIEQQRGYKTIVVWESDYREDPDSVVNFLKKELGYADCRN